MNILEFATSIKEDINIRFYSEQNYRFCASFNYMEVILPESSIFGVAGNGSTPTEALNDLTKAISTTTISFRNFNSSYSENHIKVPKLEYLVDGEY